MQNTNMKAAIVIGASSGIGKALAFELNQQGYKLGLAARRIEALEAISKELITPAVTSQMDVMNTDDAIVKFKDMLTKLGAIEMIIISAGTGHMNPQLDWSLEKETIDTNVSGFTAIAGLAYNHLTKQGYGHLAGISSILTLRGNTDAPAYNASKAFMSNYLEGLYLKSIKEKNNVSVTDIRPGFVDTPMADSKHMFWVASPEKAAKQMLRAIHKNKKVCYITKRWNLIAPIMKWAPDWLYAKT